MSFALAYITFPNEQEAEKIGKKLLEEKLIACYNLFPIKSAYLWNGKIENSEEIVGIFKTSTKNKKILEEKIISLHSYKIPCIIHLQWEANEAYENWINDSTL
jgi:periplasmic divalent cation tolerance protein